MISPRVMVNAALAVLLLASSSPSVSAVLTAVSIQSDETTSDESGHRDSHEARLLSEETLGHPKFRRTNAREADIVKGRYIVERKQVDDNVDRSGGPRSNPRLCRDLVAPNGGACSSRPFDALDDLFVVEDATEKTITTLLRDPDIVAIEHVVIHRKLGSVNNPPSWGLDQIDGSDDNKYEWKYDGSGVDVYVLGKLSLCKIKYDCTRTPFSLLCLTSLISISTYHHHQQQQRQTPV